MYKAKNNKKYGRVFKQENSKWKEVSSLKTLKKGDVFKVLKTDGSYFNVNGETEFIAKKPVPKEASIDIPILANVKSQYEQDLFLEVFREGHWLKIKSFAVVHIGDKVRYKEKGEKEFFRLGGTTIFRVVSEPEFYKGYPEVKLEPFMSLVMRQ